MIDHHTLGGWVIGLGLISLGLGSLVSWLVWKKLHGLFERTVKEENWDFNREDAEKIPIYPVLIGLIERTFFAVLVAFHVSGAASALVLWMIVKMTTGWNRVQKGGTAYRMLAFTGLICSVVSLFFAVVGGLVSSGYIPVYRLWENGW